MGSCADYSIGAAKAVGNTPSDILNAPGRIVNFLIAPTGYQVGDLIPATWQFQPSNADQQEGMQALQIAVTAAAVAGLGSTVTQTATGSAETPLVLRNAEKGQAFKDAVAAETSLTESNVVQNVSLKTQSGVRTVMDVVSTNSEGNIALREA